MSDSVEKLDLYTNCLTFSLTGQSWNLHDGKNKVPQSFDEEMSLGAYNFSVIYDTENMQDLRKRYTRHASCVL